MVTSNVWWTLAHSVAQLKINNILILLSLYSALSARILQIELPKQKTKPYGPPFRG